MSTTESCSPSKETTRFNGKNLKGESQSIDRKSTNSCWNTSLLTPQTRKSVGLFQSGCQGLAVTWCHRLHPITWKSILKIIHQRLEATASFTIAMKRDYQKKRNDECFYWSKCGLTGILPCPEAATTGWTSSGGRRQGKRQSFRRPPLKRKRLLDQQALYWHFPSKVRVFLIIRVYIIQHILSYGCTRDKRILLKRVTHSIVRFIDDTICHLTRVLFRSTVFTHGFQHAIRGFSLIRVFPLPQVWPVIGEDAQMNSVRCFHASYRDRSNFRDIWHTISGAIRRLPPSLPCGLDCNKMVLQQFNDVPRWLINTSLDTEMTLDSVPLTFHLCLSKFETFIHVQLIRQGNMTGVF